MNLSQVSRAFLSWVLLTLSQSLDLLSSKWCNMEYMVKLNIEVHPVIVILLDTVENLVGQKW